MTLRQMEILERDYVTVYEAADVIGCAPQRLRDALDIDDERPLDQRRFLFPHCKVGNRRRIMRDGFLRWVDGTMLLPDLPGMETITLNCGEFKFDPSTARKMWENQMPHLMALRGE